MARFMAESVEELLRDKTRKLGKPPLPSASGRFGLGAAHRRSTKVKTPLYR
jgi:hypothetical protein